MYYYVEDGLTRAERTKKREEEIINIIKVYYDKHNYSPTLREIAKKAGISSTSTVFRYLNKLQDKGLIEWPQRISRTIQVIDQTMIS